LKLRTQIGLVALLVLSLPLAGWHFVQQIEQVLRSGQEQALKDHARTVASLMATELTRPWPPPEGDRLYLHPADQPFLLDGYTDEWEPWLDQGRRFETDRPPRGLDFLAARSADGVYLLFRVNDPTPVFADMGLDGLVAGDRVNLVFEGPRGRQSIQIAPFAPGYVEGGSRNEGFRVRGQWQPVSGGWNLELQVLDGRVPQRMGFSVGFADDPQTREVVAVAGTGPQHDPARTLPLVTVDEVMQQRLQGLTPVGLRSWLIDAGAQVLGRADLRADTENGQEEATWLATLLFRRLASETFGDTVRRDPELGRLEGREVDEALAGRAGARWQPAPDAGVLVSAAAPVRDGERLVGAVVVERDADAMMMLTSRAVVQLFGLTLLAFAVAVIVLLGFAALLTERIRRMRNAASEMVSPDGQVLGSLPPPRMPDELGELGREMTGLLDRLREHQDYLRTLADKLTHELRTPLSLIRSSLDNLDQATDPDQARVYRQRAEAGAERLNRILQSMSQASRIEQSLVGEPLEPIDPEALLREFVAARRDIHPGRDLEVQVEGRVRPTAGSPELLAQMLDKIADNALDFSEPDSPVVFRLKARRRKVLIEVENRGPPLPEDMRGRLFESMVSVRPRKGDQPHLGLGLYVARLIAEYHGGRISAANTAAGVVVGVELPVSKASDPPG